MANRLPAQRSHWKIAALGTAFGVAIAGGVLFTNALAVHDSPFPFELDGNVADASGDGLDDWQHVFGFGGTGGALAPTTTVFIHDLPASGQKETMYDAGKDIQDVTAWTRKDVTKVVPDKDNILDAFAAQYLVDTDGDANTRPHRVIYFGADRFANNGDATMSFWFFQQHVDLTGTNGFSPGHTARNVATGQRGDILVQMDFLNGGGESRLRVFEWVGSGGSDGSLDLLRDPADVNGATVCLNDNTACATTNDVGNVTSFWPYVPKAGTAGKFPAESFFEGGIDLTALVGDVCLNSFLASTRSSQQTTSDLKDLAMGDFNTCGHIDLVRKECQADAVSPLYLADSNLYQTKHVLTIRNDGLGGDVYDVGVRDDSVGGDNICKITTISGGVGNPTVGTGIFFPDNSTYIKVADRLAAGVANQMSVTLVCTSPSNPFANTASIRAGQQPGGTSLTDTYAETGTDTTPQCVKTVNNELVLTKSCPTPVVLDASNGFKPKVCVDITLKNNGEAKVNISSLIDSHNDGTSSNLLSQVPGATHTINPGDTVSGIQDCYYPTKPDSDQTDPDKAQYGDTVNASGIPANNPGITVDATGKSTTCSLCPVGLNN